MGNGIPLNIGDCDGLQEALLHVISEVQSVHPQRVIQANIADLQGVKGDRDRLAQLLSNLVANAIHHGSQDGPVEVAARIEHDHFKLTVKKRRADQRASLAPVISALLTPRHPHTPSRAGPGAIHRRADCPGPRWRTERVDL